MSEPTPGPVPHLRPSASRWKAVLDSQRFWALAAMVVAAIPVSSAFLLPNRVFHVRDLSLFFWPRHIWFRRALFSGEWPLWDPFGGGGQSAVADALNQMFLLPAMLLRLVGSERVGFNLWIAAPFPIAAAGMYAYLLRRFSVRAAALGAIAFAVSGPVVSSGNFPNLSWSVAFMPWVLWAADRCAMGTGRARSVAWLAVMFGMQAAAGEPVTMTATGGLAFAHAVVLGAPGEQDATWRRRLRESLLVAAGLCLGGLLAAIQLVPLAGAVNGSWRSAGVLAADFWSLHPLGLAETVSVHLFGDYFVSQNFLVLPWMPPLNSGRDPFFFSVYIGPTLLAMATFGAVAGWSRRWSTFWTGAVLLAVLAASGPYTPFYPFLRAHVPFLASFRFPVKYLLVASVAVAALAAGAWDTIAGERRRAEAPARWRAARVVALALLLALGAGGYVLAAAAIYWPVQAARAFFEVARFIHMGDPVAGAAFMLGTVPGVAARLVLLSLAAALLIGVASSRRRETTLGRVVLYLLLVTDLVAASWGINPSADASVFDEPRWAPIVRAHPESLFYFGGKVDGTIAPRDPDGPRSFYQPYGMAPAETRSRISNEAAFYPAGRGARELFAFDLAVLWPRPFQLVHQRFLTGTPAERERLLDRFAVRYRVLHAPAAGPRRPLVGLHYFTNTWLYDYRPPVTRTGIVPRWTVEPDLRKEIEGLFQPGPDPATTAMLVAPPPPAVGVAGAPAPPGAHILEDSCNTVVIEAATGVGGGLLRVLDSYSPDWRVTVDGVPAVLQRADVLFRAVSLPPGQHRVVFRYRPTAFYVGAGLTLCALLLCLFLFFVRQDATRSGRARTPGDGRWADTGHAADISCQPQETGVDRSCQSPQVGAGYDRSHRP